MNENRHIIEINQANAVQWNGTYSIMKKGQKSLKQQNLT